MYPWHLCTQTLLRYSVGRWDRGITEKTNLEGQGGLVAESERKLYSF